MVRHTVRDCCGVPTMALPQSRRTHVRTGSTVDCPWPLRILSAAVRFNAAIASVPQSGAVAHRTRSLDASESTALLYGHKMNTREVSVA